MRTSNPALSDKTFSGELSDTNGIMTVDGTVNKTFILVGLAFISASWIWMNQARFIPLILPAIIAAVIVAFLTIFKKDWAPVTAPIYALCEGVALGGISIYFEKMYPGIVFQAIGLTMTTLAALLFAYRARLIRATENFRLGIFAATGGICIYYLIDLVFGFFGGNMPLIHSAGIMGIGFSVFVVIIAALNLVLDFDFIEKGAGMHAPKYMEWYAAFGLMVTLVWLYMEILRLLAKLNRR
ncbi:MAG: Bax inhibitor-1/YccA family protein [Candidatus Omnitrophota bacterium]